LINTNTILKSKVSFQKDTWSSLSKEMTIEEVLFEISKGTYKKQIDDLRELILQDKIESFKAEKLKLPAVTFCGTFNEIRRKDNLKEYNSLIIIDIDKLSEEQLLKATKYLTEDKYVFSFWLSPSHNGIKGIVSLKFNYELKDIYISHKSAFEKLSNYFLNKYDIILDSSGSDTTRLCFMSYDPQILIKNEIQQFEIDLTDLVYANQFENKESKKIKIYNTTKKNALYNPNGKNRNIDKRTIKDIITYLTKRRIVITGEYEHRYRIAYAIANTFTFEIGLKFYLDLCRIETLKYNEQKEKLLLEYCYENNTGWTKFNYIEEIAMEYGFKKKILEKVVS